MKRTFTIRRTIHSILRKLIFVTAVTGTSDSLSITDETFFAFESHFSVYWKANLQLSSQRRPAFRQNESTFSALGIQFILLNCCFQIYWYIGLTFHKGSTKDQLRYKINSCYTKSITVLRYSWFHHINWWINVSTTGISSLFLYKNQICFFDCQSVVHLLQDELAFTDLLPVHRTHLFHISGWKNKLPIWPQLANRFIKK